MRVLRCVVAHDGYLAALAALAEPLHEPLVLALMALLVLLFLVDAGQLDAIFFARVLAHIGPLRTCVRENIPPLGRSSYGGVQVVAAV